MCVNFTPPTAAQLRSHFGIEAEPELWPAETWADYLAPIVRAEGLAAANYGFIPKAHQPPGKRLTTVNARAEGVGERQSYRLAWRECRLALSLMTAFYEPCYERGRALRMRIARADGQPFAVAALWRSWPEGLAFTQLTINADGHPLMGRMHRPGDEKRSLVVMPPAAYQDWLHCRDPEQARAFLTLFPAEEFIATPAPKGAAQQALFDDH